MEKTIVKVITGIIFTLLLSSTITSADSIKNLDVSTADEAIPIVDPTIAKILNRIDEDLLGEYLKTIVDFGPRVTGTYSCEKASEYIYQQFQKMGLKTRYHNWTAFGNKYHPHLFKCRNVVATLPNLTSDKIIIFNAHYDTAANSPGAQDNGAGTAAVIAAAYALSHFEFKHTLKFIAFSGEEIGLVGSHEYAKEAYERNDNIVIDINADCIGYAKTTLGGKTMRLHFSEDAEWILNLTKKLSNQYDIGIEIIIPWLLDKEDRGYSDHNSFADYGYEAVGFWGGEGTPYGHTPYDTFDTINLSYLVKTTRIITGTLAYLANLEDFYPQIRIESPKFGKLYFEGRKKIDIGDLKTIVVDDIWIWADERASDVPIKRTEFYYDKRLVYTDTEAPFKWHFNKLSIRKHRITVIAYDELGRKSKDWRDIRFINLLKRI
jgi:hypothetical protein